MIVLCVSPLSCRWSHEISEYDCNATSTGRDCSWMRDQSWTGVRRNIGTKERKKQVTRVEDGTVQGHRVDLNRRIRESRP